MSISAPIFFKLATDVENSVCNIILRSQVHNSKTTKWRTANFFIYRAIGMKLRVCLPECVWNSIILWCNPDRTPKWLPPKTVYHRGGMRLGPHPCKNSALSELRSVPKSIPATPLLFSVAAECHASWTMYYFPKWYADFVIDDTMINHATEGIGCVV